MELCRTEITNVRKLDPKQTSDMIRATAVPAAQRKADIENMIRHTQLDVDPILMSYNIRLEYKMANLVGRVLNAPDLEYGNNRFTTSKDIGLKGQWDNIRKVFLDAKEVKNWIVVNFGRRIRPNEVEEFIRSLQTTASTHGIRISQPIDLVQGDSRCNDEKRALDIFMKMSEKYKTAEFYLVILPGTTPIYSKKKKILFNFNKFIQLIQ